MRCTGGVSGLLGGNDHEDLAPGELGQPMRQGYVVDFVSLGIGDLRWPAFNVADPAVVGGIILLVIYLTFFAEEARSRDEPAV